MAGDNGGGAFVILYLVSLILISLPIMVSEFIIGRNTRKNVISAFTALKTSPLWKIIGWFGVLSALVILMFYSSIAGWIYSYAFKALRGDFSALKAFSVPSDAAQNLQEQFTTLQNSPIWANVAQLIVLIVVALVLIGGVRGGIERVTKILMPVFFALILICCISSVRLSGFSEGLKFLFAPDFSEVGGGTVIAAMGLAFFKLSVGMGTMITYAGYFNKSDNLIEHGMRVAFSDLGVSLLMGVIVFPVVFTFGMDPAGGYGLLFNTLPLAFMHLPAGTFLLILFFLLACIPSTTAMISMAEVIVVFISEQFHIQRKTATLITIGVVAAIGLPTVNPGSVFGGATIFGMPFSAFFDYFSSNLLRPLGGLLIAIFTGYFLDKNIFKSELTNYGMLKDSVLVNLFRFILRYITPILIVVVFLSSFGVFTI
jgi:NSS family neurotransmitter:Na+ symporter